MFPTEDIKGVIVAVGGGAHAHGTVENVQQKIEIHLHFTVQNKSLIGELTTAIKGVINELGIQNNGSDKFSSLRGTVEQSGRTGMEACDSVKHKR